MKYRITITFDLPEDPTVDDEEIIRRGIADVLDGQLAENVKIRVEDEYCINKNDRQDKEKIRCSKCGNSYPPKAIANDGTGICVNCMIAKVANARR